MNMKKHILLAASALAAAFCLSAQAPVTDARGVTVDLGGAPYLHRSPVVYPREALQKGVEGTVVAQVKIGPTGEVTDASIVSGPDALRRTVLQSVLNWHFSKEVAGATRQVTVSFQTPKEDPAAAAAAVERIPVSAQQTDTSQPPRTVNSIAITGLSDEARAQLLAQLPVHEGEPLSQETFSKAMQAVTGFDSHLGMLASPGPTGQVSLRIAPGLPQLSILWTAELPQRIRVGGNVQQSKLVSQVRPVYPPDAKAQGVQGVVQLQAVIGKDGSVQQLTVMSGDPMLVPSALQAVKQWVYAPTLLNGNPVEVATQIDVNYTLSQ